MAKIELELNEETIERLKAEASVRHEAFERYVARVLENSRMVPALSIVGSFADCSDELDQIVDEAMRDRRTRSLRSSPVDASTRH